MKVFMIGATGFLGYHATRLFLERGHEVATISLPPMPEEDLLPREVQCTLGNIDEMTDEALISLMSGFNTFIFAAGRDERTPPKAPAYEFFHKHNVASCSRMIQLAKEAGCTRAVVLNSYFSYFAREWPQFNLTAHHPYIRSRVVQADAAIQTGGAEMEVMILELPYIFGAMPGRIPLWKEVLLDRFKKSKKIFFMEGGTACVTVKQVSQAIVGAAEKGKGGMRYPVGGTNITWDKLFKKLSDLAFEETKKMQKVPKWILKLAVMGESRKHRKKGLEGGLNSVKYMDVQCSKTFLDPSVAAEALGVEPDDLDTALKETVLACYPENHPDR